MKTLLFLAIGSVIYLTWMVVAAVAIRSGHKTADKEIERIANEHRLRDHHHIDL